MRYIAILAISAKWTEADKITCLGPGFRFADRGGNTPQPNQQDLRPRGPAKPIQLDRRSIIAPHKVSFAANLCSLRREEHNNILMRKAYRLPEI
jgi:hypothetical protein